MSACVFQSQPQLATTLFMDVEALSPAAQAAERLSLRPDSRQKDVPEVRGPIEDGIELDGARRNAIIGVIEQDQLHDRSACREDAEVCSVGTQGREYFTEIEYCGKSPKTLSLCSRQVDYRGPRKPLGKIEARRTDSIVGHAVVDVEAIG